MVSNFYVRGVGKLPMRMRCKYGLIDDGKDCVKKNTCTRKRCTTNKTGCLECSGDKIVTKLKNRLRCSDDDELEDGLCFKKCSHGYVSNGSKCIKGLHKKAHQGKSKSKSIINTIIDFIKNVTMRTEKFTNIAEWDNTQIQLIVGILLFIFLISYYY